MSAFSFIEKSSHSRNIVLQDPSEVTDNFRNRLLNGEFESITINYQVKSEFDINDPTICRGSNSPFANISTLKSITAKILLGDKIQTLGGLFYGCTSLESIPHINTKNIIDMNRMFMGCGSLKSIPELDTSSCNNMFGMFCGCSALTTIPKLNTGRVWNMGSMFMNAVALTSIPALDLGACISTNSMFLGAVSLTKVPLMDTSHVSDVGRMFMSCRTLEELPEFDFTSARNMNEIYFNCPFRRRNPVVNSVDDLAQDVLAGMEEGTIKSLTINYDTTARTSPFSLMDHKVRKSLSEIKFRIIVGPKVHSLSGLFCGMKGLKTAPFIDTSGVSVLSRMFEGCSHLEKVPLYSLKKANDLRRMFAGCDSLTKKPDFKLDATIDTKDMNISGTALFLKDTAYRFRYLPLIILMFILRCISFVITIVLRVVVGILNFIIYYNDETSLFGGFSTRLKSPLDRFLDNSPIDKFCRKRNARWYE